MLTKEEANNLLKDLGMNPNAEAIMIPNAFLKRYIAQYTEKENPKIQVGDIYRDGWGNLVEISGKTIDGRYFCETGGRYDEKGHRVGVLYKLVAHKLDLSKKYMLVEVEGE